MQDLPSGPLIMRTNADFRKSLRIVRPHDPDDEEGADRPLDLSATETTLLMHIRDARDSATVWMELSTANGRLVKTVADEGGFAFNVAAADIARLLPPGEHYITDLRIALGGGLVTVPFERPIHVVEGITR